MKLLYRTTLADGSEKQFRPLSCKLQPDLLTQLIGQTNWFQSNPNIIYVCSFMLGEQLQIMQFNRKELLLNDE
ncbi:hypothetical protein N9M64_00130 [bacterium]|nr:hypothetical protein [bacterium]